MDYHFASDRDLVLLAEWNSQLICDEGHRNRMTVPELRERMRGWLEGEYKAAILTTAGKPVAYALYRESDEGVHLRQLFVGRDHRRQGIGRKAIEILHKHIWPSHKRLTVEVLTSNTVAIDFWRAVGYRDYCLKLEVTPGMRDADQPAAMDADTMTDSVPLLEFDPERAAVLEPMKVIEHRDLPEHCILCFFREVISRAKEKLDLRPLPPLKSEMGEIPVFSAMYDGHPLGILPAAVGAPLAAAHFEEAIARGGRKFIACGVAGVLDSLIGSGDIVVPVSAVRDEGTSYHYLPAGREAHPSLDAVDAITRVLGRRECSYVKGKTWTTDGVYRETPNKVAARRKEGCIAVEMEAAALFAVAEFRGVQIGQLLYGGDDVSGITWDPREFGQKIPARETLFWLSVEACIEM